MLFNSIGFISVFLPLAIFCYYLSPKHFRNITLFVVSILFYAFLASQYLWLLVLVVITTYLGGILISRAKKIEHVAQTVVVVCVLAFLFYFKYFSFFQAVSNSLFNTDFEVLNLVLPLGISFYTFQALSYLIDVGRGVCAVQKNFLNLALYLMLFPPLISGPIVRYSEMENQIINREESFEKIKLGITRFVVGLSKKVIIADLLGVIADKIFVCQPDSISHFVAWTGAFTYLLQIYYDFSGYSDMAIGLCLIFGFSIPENFNYPLTATSVSDFWRRWNITLSAWFRDYLFYPIMRSKVVNNLVLIFSKFLNKTIATNSVTVVALIFTWALIGLWHGDALTFLIYGIFHGVLISLEFLFGINKKSSNKVVNFTKHIYLLFAVTVGIVIFRAENITYAIGYLKNMFLAEKISSNIPLLYYFDTFDVLIIALAILFAFPVFEKFYNSKTKLSVRVKTALLALLVIICFAQIADMSYTTFIYFKF